MPDLPSPPSSRGVISSPSLEVRALVERCRAALAAVRSSPLLGAGAAIIALVVVAGLAWTALRGGGLGAGAAGGAPVELSLPRAGPGAPRSAPPARPASGTTIAGGSGAAASNDAAAVVVVHVAGAVAHPGLYQLGPAARVADALDAAGGPAADADVDALNLAAKLNDGDRVYVVRRGETPPIAISSFGVAGARAGPVDLNTATAEELDLLPGVGPATAEAIISYRSEHGRFASVDDLLQVHGIGAAKLEALRSKVRVR